MLQRRPINADEAAVLDKALHKLGAIPEAESLRGSIPSLRVVGRCECGCASVDFKHQIDPSEIRIIADGIGVTPSGGEVGVIVWGSQIRITGLEVYDLGAGESDLNLPEPETLQDFGEDVLA